MTHSIVFDIVSYGVQNSILDIKKSEGKAVFCVQQSRVHAMVCCTAGDKSEGIYAKW